MTSRGGGGSYLVKPNRDSKVRRHQETEISAHATTAAEQVPHPLSRKAGSGFGMTCPGGGSYLVKPNRDPRVRRRKGTEISAHAWAAAEQVPHPLSGKAGSGIRHDKSWGWRILSCEAQSRLKGKTAQGDGNLGSRVSGAEQAPHPLSRKAGSGIRHDMSRGRGSYRLKPNRESIGPVNC
jgi:hypothetical protein